MGLEEDIQLLEDVTGKLHTGVLTKHGKIEVKMGLKMKIFLKFCKLIIEIEPDSLNTAFRLIEDNKNIQPMELLLRTYNSIDDTSQRRCNMLQILKIFESIFCPLKIFRAITAGARSFFNGEFDRVEVGRSFGCTLDLLDKYIEAKSDTIHQDSYFLMNKFSETQKLTFESTLYSSPLNYTTIM